MYFTQGLSPIVIGAKVGMTYRSVLRRLRQAGYTGRCAGRGRWTDSRLSALARPSLLDIAWAAGVYEGEGSCVIRRKSDVNRSACISVVQKDRWLCDRLRMLFGGSVGKDIRATAGRLEKMVFYCWRLTGMRARGFMMTIYKFLSPRRQLRIKEALAA